MRCDEMRCDAMRCDEMRCDAMRCDEMRSDAIRCNQSDPSQSDAISPIRRNQMQSVRSVAHLQRAIVPRAHEQCVRARVAGCGERVNGRARVHLARARGRARVP